MYIEQINMYLYKKMTSPGRKGEWGKQYYSLPLPGTLATHDRPNDTLVDH